MKNNILKSVFTAPIKAVTWTVRTVYNITAKPVVTPIKNQVEESAGRIGALVKNLNPIGSKQRYEENSRKETFEQATKRLNVNDKDLQKSYNTFSLMTKLSTLCFSICVIGAIHNLAKVQIVNSIEFLAFGFLHLAIAHKYSFRAYQIRQRKLGGHEEYLREINEWFPKKWSVKENG